MSKVQSYITKKKQDSMPDIFTGIANCRIIIDCTEFFIETPKIWFKCSKQQKKVTSKKGWLQNTFGVAPNGSITFVSDGYPGSTSDKMILNHSNIISHLEVCLSCWFDEVLVCIKYYISRSICKILLEVLD